MTAPLPWVNSTWRLTQVCAFAGSSPPTNSRAESITDW
jgi:hypothetical protein